MKIRFVFLNPSLTGSEILLIQNEFEINQIQVRGEDYCELQLNPFLKDFFIALHVVLINIYPINISVLNYMSTQSLL